MPWPFDDQGMSLWYPLSRRLGGPQSWYGHFGEEKNPLSLARIKPRLLSPWCNHYIDYIVLGSVMRLDSSECRLLGCETMYLANGCHSFRGTCYTCLQGWSDPKTGQDYTVLWSKTPQCEQSLLWKFEIAYRTLLATIICLLFCWFIISMSPLTFQL